MENYPSNSNLSKQTPPATIEKKEEPRAKKVVSGNVKVVKQSKAKKFANEFISEDVHNVKSYIFSDIFVPALKKTIMDICTNGLAMILGQDVRPTKGSFINGYSNNSRVSYGNFYPNDHRQPIRRAIGGFDLDDILLEDKGEAEAILVQLDEIMDRYRVVRVLDLYDLVGITPPHTADRYGWTDIRSARVIRTLDGYLIQMPRPMVLD